MWLTWIFVLGLSIAGAVLWQRAKGRESRRRRSLLESFGHPLLRERDIDRLSALFRARQLDDPSLASLPEQTWVDLEMDRVFEVLDRTSSKIGAQTLYDRLRRPDEGDALFESLDRLADHFLAREEDRLRYQRTLHTLEEWHVSYLADLLWNAPPPPFRVGSVLLASMGLLPAVLALSAFLWPRMLLLALLAVCANLCVRVILRTRIDPHIPGLRALPKFILATRWVATQSDEVCADVRARLLPHLWSLHLLDQPTRWLVLDSTSEAWFTPLGGLTQSVYEYASMAFLLDINAFQHISHRLQRGRKSLQAIFGELGSLDLAISVASIRKGARDRWTRPVNTVGSRHLCARGLVHPLLSQPVGNDVLMEGMNWLVTGSNMSGKSTLLRTVGVNALLARSLGTVFATQWEAPLFTVRTCIGHTDSTAHGKSYYMAEAEAVRELVDAAAATTPHLFIIDELFRGTNTIERIAAARSILTYLDRDPHLVLVATHDIELAAFLSERYAPFHFREQISDEELVFDFLLKPGISSTRNALALLAAMRFPAAVVKLARETIVTPAT